MLNLPNNCRAGQFSIFPKNWQSPKANIKLTWRLSYWFFDDNLNQKKKIVIKSGINRVDDLRERQKLMKAAEVNEKELLESGINRITKTKEVDDTSEISARSYLLKALEYSLKTHHADHDTKIDIASSLKYFSIAAKTLGYDRLPVGEVRPKHIKFILNECGNIKTYTTPPSKKHPNGLVKEKLWNDRLFNHTRANISCLFPSLVEVEAIELNPVAGVIEKTKVKKIRETPTEKEREMIRSFKETRYPFYRFTQIFHHSGGRIKELLAVRKKDVNIDLSHENPAKHIQQYKVTIKKGGKHQEVIKQIKDLALPYWQEILSLATKEDQFLFSRGLVPGYNAGKSIGKPIRGGQISRRYREHGKKKLGITADFYALKHLNITEMMDILKDEKEVAKLTAHTTNKENNTLAKVYDMNNQKRKDDLIKSVNNPL